MNRAHWMVAVALLAAAPAQAGETISVLFVRTADDDGSHPSTLTQSKAQSTLAEVTAIYQRNGGDLTFVLDPTSSFTTVQKSTLLNHDCILQPGWTAHRIAVEPRRQDDDTNFMCDQTRSGIERNRWGVQCGGKLVVFSRTGGDRILWDGSKYNYSAHGPNFSSKGLSYVVVDATGGGADLAHEIGHYLSLSHPFHKAEDTAAAERRIAAWIQKDGHAAADGLNALDGDGLSDTPPDSGPGPFNDAYGKHTACEKDHPTVPLTVTVGGHAFHYTLAPDRHNVMGYFDECPNLPQHLSAQQWQLVHAALSTGNRVALVKRPQHECHPSRTCPPAPGPHLQTPEHLQAFQQAAMEIQACYKIWHLKMPIEVNRWTQPNEKGLASLPEER